MSRRACAVIPGYNAAATIGPLVTQVKQLGLDTIVVNDGSTDHTAQLATTAGALVISHLQNRGKGTALRTGFAFALEAGYESIITLDGDGQHDPQEIPRLLEAMSPPEVALVVGHRLVAGAAMPLVRRWTNQVMSWLVSWLVRQSIPDSQCGFRVIHRSVLETLHLSACRFDLETELLLAASRHGLTVKSIPIRTIYHNHPSHIRPVRDGLRFVRLVVRHLFLATSRR